MQKKMRPKILKGIVVSNKMTKTIVVEVVSFVKHPKYQKYTKRSKKYKAHDEKSHTVGDTVFIKECAPISKDKHFMVIENKE